MIENCKYWSKSDIRNKMNDLGQNRIPFLFIINYNISEAVLVELKEINPDEIKYNFENISNIKLQNKLNENLQYNVIPFAKQKYLSGFNKVMDHIKFGNTYLLNLTFPSQLITENTLADYYESSKAKYKLYLKDKFTCFSPEPFVKIEGNKISAFPMKGTISTEIHNAKEILLNDEKEIAEHYTIVDLLRNDLSQVAKHVRVESFRYFEEINTKKGKILQTSSKITGKLQNNWNEEIGSIILKLLPAGSVTGAPKAKTLEIIESTEQYDRGYYTGIAGIYDGKNLNSCVLIRFIEKNENGLQFKSGGGITSMSSSNSEYNELIEKIYVPTF